MKSFGVFRLDITNQCLWRGQERVPIAPKAFDVLRYLVENAGRLVTQDEILEKLWSETYVNQEVFRKYILDIRKILGDRPDRPEFIETVTKRGYRFIAPVVDETTSEPQNLDRSDATAGPQTNENVATSSDRKHPIFKRTLWKLALIPALAIAAVAAVGISRDFRRVRSGLNVPWSSNTSIAVLPFADMSPSKDQEYFSDGLSEQLIHDLAKVPRLKVVGRSSAFQFKGKNVDLREVGKKLGVANVLEGSVRREGNHVRITAELIKADDGFQLWSQTYDRDISDIFSVQDEISRSTTEALKLKLLGSNGQAVPSTVRSANPKAYEAYLQANYFWGRGQSAEDLEKTLAYVDTAIDLDKTYAPAWALRAMVHNRMVGVTATDSADHSRKALDDAGRAIALDPNSASGYLALARTQIDFDWDWDAANASLTKAAALEPGNVDIIRVRSRLFWVSGDLDQAVKLAEQVVALDPLRANSYLGLGYLLYLAGRYDDARAALQKTLELNPQAAFVHSTFCRILIAQRMPQQALAEIEKEPSEWAKLTGEAVAYRALGRQQDSNSVLAELIAKYGNGAAFQVAQVYAYRGEPDKSFEWLERAYKQRDGGLSDMKADPLLQNLRRDPRYTALLKKMRLPT